MADPTLNPEHVAQGLSRLLTQFHDSPNLKEIARSYLNQIQEIEIVVFSLMAERYVDTAIGAQLDGVGRVVGEPRAGRTNTDYRVAIKGRITRNAADSKIEDLIALFVLLLPGYTFEVADGPGPAAFRLTVVEALPAPPAAPSPDVLASQLLEAKGAGIRATMLFSEADRADTFTTADAAVLQASATQGTGDPMQTTGGRLSGAIGGESE